MMIMIIKKLIIIISSGRDRRKMRALWSCTVAVLDFHPEAH